MATKEMVLVTGGSGYLALWVIAKLLRDGFNVRTTLRTLQRREDVIATLAARVPSIEGLSFTVTDLLRDDGWKEAVDGCQYVVHVASPMGQGDDKGSDLIAAAREGTLRVLSAAANGGVQRVVCTSSGYAAKNVKILSEKRSVADENTWTDLNDKTLNEYAISKALAERSAWDFMKSNKSAMTLTTVIPGLIVGPVMGKTVSGSLEVVSRLLAGKLPALPNVGFSISDTRDLADLHIRAMLRPEAANQRFIGVGDFLWFTEIAEALRKRFPERAKSIPARRLPDWFIKAAAPFQADMRFLKPMLGKREEFSSQKAFDLLQWQPRPSTDAVVECAASLIANRIV